MNYFPSLGSLIEYIGHACTGDVLVAVIDLMRSIVSVVSMLIYVDKWLLLLNLLVIDLDLEGILRLHQRTLSSIIFAVIVCFRLSSRSSKAYHAKNGALSIILNLVVHLVVRQPRHVIQIRVLLRALQVVALVIQVPICGNPFLFLTSQVALNLILGDIGVDFACCWLLRFGLSLTTLVPIENLCFFREVRRSLQARHS